MYHMLDETDVSVDFKAPRGAIWAADIAIKIGDWAEAVKSRALHGSKRITRFAPVQFINDQFWEPTTIDECSTAEHVRAYARSIARTQPSFASELIAIANRADGMKD